jgi:hypothetical protein
VWRREYTVATCRLGLVKRIVGVLRGLIEAVVSGIATRDAAADRKPNFAARAADGDLTDCLPDTLGDKIGAIRRGVR